MLTHWVLPLRYRRSRAYMIVQVKNWVRPLTPEEYDEAVATNITECPLALGGDQRSGRQLIMDAPHDAFAHTVAALSQTPEGRRRLEAAVVGNSSRGVAAALASLTGGGGAVTFGPGHGPGPQSSAGHRGKSKWIPGPCQHAPPAVLAPGPGLQAVAVAGAAGPSRRPTHIRTTWRWIRSGGRTRAAAVVPRPRCSAGPMLRPGTWRWICTISRGRGFRPLHHPRQVVTKRGGRIPWGDPAVGIPWEIPLSIGENLLSFGDGLQSPRMHGWGLWNKILLLVFIESIKAGNLCKEEMCRTPPPRDSNQNSLGSTLNE